MRRIFPVLFVLLLSACASGPMSSGSMYEGPPRKETVFAVTDAGELIRFSSGQPGRVQDRKPVQGLQPGDQLVGIDFRVAKGVLYALSASGRLYTLDTMTGRLTPVGNGAAASLTGAAIGFDFNPAADRIRVVSDTGMNLRLHPDTGALAATDPALQYDANDVNKGKAPRVTAAGYTYNKRNEKITTNFAIDLAAGALVMQGSKEGLEPVVSPNTGRLFTVGSLGVGNLEGAVFDIADLDNTALAALRVKGVTRLYYVDLATGRATTLGTVGDGRALRGLAIEP